MSKPLFVCPTQQLKEGCAADALTCNEFFGVNELGQKNEKKKMEYTQYETIVFEEVFFNSIDMMKHIYQLLQKIVLSELLLMVMFSNCHQLKDQIMLLTLNNIKMKLCELLSRML
jgi:hypothetical protein